MAIKKKSRQRLLRENLKYPIKDIQHNLTKTQYSKILDRFAKFCYLEYGSYTIENCKTHIQDYADSLVDRNLSPSTIHTYIAAVCKAFEIPMSEINKPLRHTADFTRCRKRELPINRNDMDLKNFNYKRVVDFQKHVGIRRNELKHVRGNDLINDENGDLCVVVRKGKGGKRQLQRIEEGYEEFIKSYFVNKKDDEYIFTDLELNNKLNFHALRAQRAQDEYFLTLKKHDEDINYRVELEKKVRNRWKENLNKNGQPKVLKESEINGYYYLRDKNKEFAKANGLPLKYDKLAVLWVSITVLAHWRNDVTIHSYLNIIPNL